MRTVDVDRFLTLNLCLISDFWLDDALSAKGLSVLTMAAYQVAVC